MSWQQWVKQSEGALEHVLTVASMDRKQAIVGATSVQHGTPKAKAKTRTRKVRTAKARTAKTITQDL